MTEKATDRGDNLDSTATGDDNTDLEAGKKEELEAAGKAEAEAKVKAEAEAKAGAEAEAKAKADKEKGIMIPKARFDEGIKKARTEAEAALKRLAEAEAKLKESEGKVNAEQVESDIDKLEEDLEKARADGNAEKAAALRKQIRGKVQLLADARADAKANMAVAIAVEKVKYESVVSKMEEVHPELNPDDTDNYDQEKVDEVLELKEAFEAAGHASSAALDKALKHVYKGGKGPEKDTKAAAEAEAKAKAEAEKRTAEAAKRGLDTKNAQPADAKAGADSDKGGKTGSTKDTARMSDSEFNKLTEDEKRKLRGDDL